MSDNGVVVWEDPPDSPHYGYQGKWFPILQPLMDHPGRWARVLNCSDPLRAYQTVSNLSRRRLAVPVGRWEFAARKLASDLGHGVYARYLGPEDGGS